MSKEIIPAEQIALRIRHFRGEKVLLDFDLAALYGAETRVTNQAVRRNADRFPADFTFQLSGEEAETRALDNVTVDIGASANPPG